MTFAPERIHPSTWPAIFAVLEPGMRHADYTASDLVNDLVDNLAQLWVLRKGGDPIAAAVSELVPTPTGLVVHGRLCAGERMGEWVDDLIACIRAHAERVGATRIEIDGRSGWKRVLGRRGWGVARITMALPIETKVTA